MAAADRTLATRARARDDWPASHIELRPISDLVPYARNARTHDDSQVAQIAASIKEFGWTIPCLIDEDGGLIAGHGRILAARKLGISEIPTMTARGWTEAQKRAYVLLDNQLPQNAGWDMDLLRVEIGDLQSEGFNLDLIGFDTAFLDKVLAGSGTQGLTDPDEVPETPTDPVSRTGDVWIMGKHRLLCGDSTVATDVERALAGVKPLLMVTDPPYGVDYDPTWRNERDLARGMKPAIAQGKVQNDDRADWRETWALFPGEVAYVWHAGTRAACVAESLEACDFQIRSQIIWAKHQFTLSRGHYHVQHEPCWYAVRGTGNWQGDRKQSTLWQIDGWTFGAGKREAEDKATGHGTQKPVECMKRPIENNSSPGQAVYEPFCGSGTTIIAAEMTARSCHAIELSPAYVDVSVTRWERFTGLPATLEGDGRTFAEVMAERAAPGAVQADVKPKKRAAR